MKCAASLVAVLIMSACAATESNPRTLLAQSVRRFMEGGDAATSLAGIDEVLRQKPDWADAHEARGSLLAAVGRTSEALESYGRALALQPAHLAALPARGLLLATLGRTDEAIADFSALIDAVPKSADGYILRGWAARRTGRFSEAERDLAEARAREPGRWEAYHGAGVSAAAAGRWTFAERDFELALFMRPDSAPSWISLSRVHAALEQPDRALEDLDRADRARPNDASVWYARGELLRSLARHVEAIRAYDRAIALGDAAIMHVGRAQSKDASGDRDGALADFDRALEIEPGLREGYIARARFHRDAGRYEPARTDYEAALRIRASAQVARELGQLHAGKERWDLAVDSYKAALTICVDEGLRPVLERELDDARARKK